MPSRLLDRAALCGGNAAFLRATCKMRRERLCHDWFPPPAPPPPQRPPEPPAWAIELGAADATDAVLSMPSGRNCSVPPVRHTRGGRALERWHAFVAAGGLKSYAAHRNNPLAADGKGASRMSAYVNLGMIDVYTIARDATAAKADKFLAEFVGFRESPYLWCLLHPRGYCDAALAVPAWARSQLGGDSTENAIGSVSLGQLERGQSADAIWNDCQRSLILSGELHNNVSAQIRTEKIRSEDSFRSEPLLV